MVIPPTRPLQLPPDAPSPVRPSLTPHPPGLGHLHSDVPRLFRQVPNRLPAGPHLLLTYALCPCPLQRSAHRRRSMHISWIKGKLCKCIKKRKKHTSLLADRKSYPILQMRALSLGEGKEQPRSSSRGGEPCGVEGGRVRPRARGCGSTRPGQASQDRLPSPK